MRARIRHASALVLAAAAGLMLAVAVPASAAPPGNPFVGSWETIYSDPTGPVPAREIHSTIGGRGHVQAREAVGGICYARFGDFMPLSASGTGTVISEDPYVFEAYVDVYCYPRDGQGRQLAFEGWHVMYQYEPLTDTLRALNYPPTAENDCIWRSGSDASVCPD